MYVVPAAWKSHACAVTFPEDSWETPHHFPVPPQHPSFHPDQTSLPFISTKIDWKQTPTAHVFRINLPGMRKEQVKVDLERGRVLKIIGEMCVEKEDRLNNWHLIERSGGRFIRSVPLPEDSKPHETEAHMEDGVLTIKVPRTEVRYETVHIAVR